MLNKMNLFKTYDSATSTKAKEEALAEITKAINITNSINRINGYSKPFY